MAIRSLPPIEHFTSSTGAEIYRIPVEAFPSMVVYCYVVLEIGKPTLIDTGSGFGHSNDDLIAGISRLREDFGVPLALQDIRHIIVTHGHIDHVGGLAFIQAKTGALVGVHALERRLVSAYEERVIVASNDLRYYLERAGVGADLRQSMLELYGFAKKHVRSVKVDFLLEENSAFEGMEFYHTPGHCSGQVCILMGDILLTADHILPSITPHQSPESITNYTGIGHYLSALTKIEKLEGVRLGLGGHEQPIENIYARIPQLRVSVQRKLERVMDAIRAHGQPASVSDISKIMYPNKHGYDILLALEETGAYVEYLYDHGELAVANLAEIERGDTAALRYALT
jgi:glyoxylase-like metal-dependent hydrolase (beta-lactamase superfamily II)